MNQLHQQIIKLMWQGYNDTEILNETSLTANGLSNNIRLIKVELGVKTRKEIKDYYQNQTNQ
jgi:hypothetical protein